jgi:hypothetical protein
MFGQIVVTKDVDAYLKSNPLAAPAKLASVPAPPTHTNH